MKHPIGKTSAVMAAMIIAGLFSASATATDGSTSLSTGQQHVATKFASPFATLAGSQENAVALATALRTGTVATLTYTKIVDGKPVIVTETITPPTKAMGWGNVSHALALAQYSLTHAGITQPTAADLQAALIGGKITTSDGKIVQLDGVLTQRASGMGWGQIARSEGTTMGAVNHGLKASTTLANGSGATDKIAANSKSSAGGMTSAGGASVTGQGKGVVTTGGAGSGSKGLTTAGGTPAGSNAGAKGLTTAGGTPAGSNATSKGLTTAGGTPAGAHAGAKGLTTAGGATGASGLATASGGHGGSNAASHGLTTASGGSSTPLEHGKGKGGG
jgi:hypothetical protein